MGKTRLSGSISVKNPNDGKYYKFEFEKSGWLSTNGFFHFNARIPKYAQTAIYKRLKMQMGTLLKGSTGS